MIMRFCLGSCCPLCLQSLKWPREDVIKTGASGELSCLRQNPYPDICEDHLCAPASQLGPLHNRSSQGSTWITFFFATKLPSLCASWCALRWRNTPWGASDLSSIVTFCFTPIILPFPPLNPSLHTINPSLHTTNPSLHTSSSPTEQDTPGYSSCVFWSWV